MAIDQEGKVMFDNFVDVFTNAPPGLRRELSKPIGDDEMAVIKEAFAKFDTDNSGKIDLKELQQMCQEMGKKLPDKQAEQAMAQLDQNGDGTVDFDEFVLWWTCTPGLGGYNHVALGFLKSKLVLKSTAKTVFSKIARGKLDNTNEFVWNGSVDITPNYLDGGKGSEDRMGISFKAGASSAPKESKASLTLKCKDADAAASFISWWGEIAAAVIDDGGPPTAEGFPSASQDKDAVVLSSIIPDEALMEFAQIVPILEAVLKKCEGRISFGANFADVVENPFRPLPNHFKGVKITGDVAVNLEAIGAMLSDTIPFGMGAMVGALIKVFAGLMQECKFGYDDTGPLMIVSRLGDFVDEIAGYGDKTRAAKISALAGKNGVPVQGIEKFRTVFYKQIREGGDTGVSLIAEAEGKPVW